MCTLLVWKNRHPEYPIIVAANRDEFEGRPASASQRLSERPLVIGGRDEQAFGTWLAVSEAGIIVALTNRRGAGQHDPARRSRGRLVLELAQLPSLARIRDAVSHIDAHTYNPFVLVALDARDSVVVHAGTDGVTTSEVADGVHAVTNWQFDAHDQPKTRRALELAATFDLHGDTADLAKRLHTLLADHAPGEHGMDGGLCVHRSDVAYGTRSSAIVMLAGRASQTSRFFYIEGHPCTHPLQEVTALLGREDSARAAVEP